MSPRAASRPSRGSPSADDRLRRLAGAAVVAVALAGVGCGQRGPLYLPGAPPAGSEAEAVGGDAAPEAPGGEPAPSADRATTAPDGAGGSGDDIDVDDDEERKR